MNYVRLNLWLGRVLYRTDGPVTRRNSSVVSIMVCFNSVNHLLLDIFTTNSLHRPTVDINEEPQSISTGNAAETLALAGDFSTTFQEAKTSKDLLFCSCPLLSV